MNFSGYLFNVIWGVRNQKALQIGEVGPSPHRFRSRLRTLGWPTLLVPETGEGFKEFPSRYSKEKGPIELWGQGRGSVCMDLKTILLPWHLENHI